MRSTLGRVLVATLLVAMSGLTAHAADEKPALHWYKGNTHTHTLNSDGDSTPDEVVRWYREHGYQFLVLTDHNFLTNTEALQALHGADEQFLVIPGEEVTDVFEKKPIHVNGLDLDVTVDPQGGTSVADTLQRDVTAIRKAHAIPHINHPNYEWAITTDDLLKVNDYKLFEIFNGHPFVNNVGGGGRPGLEEMWDTLLTSGKLVYGIAVDDAHHFKAPWNRTAAKPGQGWVVVRAPKLEANAILSAMEAGDFYASTGVELSDVVIDDTHQSLTVKEGRSTMHRVQFIGSGGRVLAEEIGNPAIYTYRGDEGYVRAKVIDSNGHFAWTQPHFVKPRG